MENKAQAGRATLIFMKSCIILEINISGIIFE